MAKVFFLLSTLSTGGGERVASDLLINLSDDIEKSLVLLENKISYPYKGNVFLLGVNKFLALLKFRQLVKKEKPDYVISFGKIPNLINIFSGSEAVVRVDNFYSLSCFGLKGLIYKLLVRIFFNKAYKIIVISKESGNDLIKNFGIKKEKLQIIYNPLDILKIQNLCSEKLEEKYENIFKNPVIITIGQLGKQKNQDHLIKSFRLVKDRVKEAKLVILGQGSFENDLKNTAEKLGIKEDVYFLGWQKNPFKFLANSKVFVLSSLWEGLPCSILEAMACKVPVVSYDCSSGPREILAPKTNENIKTNAIEYAEFGVLVKQKDINLLSEAIIHVLSDNNFCETIKSKSIKRAEDFNAKNIIKKWNFLKN